MSSSTVTRMPTRASRRLPPLAVMVLVAQLALLVVGALQGGIAMVVDPITPLGMQVTFLEGTPVDTYFWPGMFLLGIALASLITIPGLLGWRWAWASPIERALGYRWAWLGVVSIGGVLLIFEVIELFMVPFHPVMHPLLIGWSVAMIGLALTTSVRGHLVVG